MNEMCVNQNKMRKPKIVRDRREGQVVEEVTSPVKWMRK